MFGVRLLLLFSVAVWGSTFVATRICLEELRPVELVGLRFGIGLPILGAILLARRTRFAFRRGDWTPLATGAAIVAAHFLLQAVALTLTTASRTGWIIAVIPLVIAVLAAVLLGERVGLRVWSGIAVSTLGLVVLVSNGRPAELDWIRNTGDGLVLVSAFTWALYTITTRNLSRAHDPLAVTFVVYVPLLAVTLAWIARHPPARGLTELAPRTLLALVFLGALGTVVQWFWQIGIARIGAARAGVFLYLEPLFTTALAVPVLGEPFGSASAAGGLLILAGVWWAEKREPSTS